MTDGNGVVLSRLVAAQAERDPGRLVFVFENGNLPAERVTAGDMAVRAGQVAWALDRQGLSPGERVAVMMRNHPEFVHTLVALSRLGLTAVPVDPAARGDRLARLLRGAGCAALVTADYLVDDPAVTAAVHASGVATWVLSTAEGRTGGLDLSRQWPVLNEVLEGPERPHVGERVGELSHPWLLAWADGTSAPPRAVVLSHERLRFYRRVPDLFGYRPDDVPYTGLPLTGGNALLVTMLPALWGAVHHAVFSRTATCARLWDVCIDHRCTTWSNAGGIATALYGDPSSPRDRAHPVRMVVSTGMPREIWRPFEERFGVRVLEWYGTPEGGFACNPVGTGPVGSFGKPPEGVLEMDVVDEDGRPVPPGRLGELVLRPVGGEASVIYFGDAELSARAVRGGWLHTGDMVTRDEQGWLFFGFHRTRRGPVPVPDGTGRTSAEPPPSGSRAAAL